MTRTTRRTFATGLAAAGLVPGLARAQQDYPAGLTVKFIVGYPAGGGQDVVGRIVADRLGALWKVPTIVENVPGASANLGMDRVAKGPTDGTQILIVPPNISTNQFMFARMPFNPETDIIPLVSGGEPAEPAVRAQGPAGQLRSGADRLRQGQSWQAQLRLARHRHHGASLGRALQAHGRRRDGRPCTTAAARRRSTISSVRRPI